MTRKSGLLAAAVLVFSLAACGSAPTGAGAAANGSQPVSNAGGGASLTQEQLVFGSLSLEQTDLQITPAQAEALLPFWKAYQSLLQSDTAAQAELAALLDQIQEAMTPEQLEAIAALDIDLDDPATLMEELGLRSDLEERAEGESGGFFRQGQRPEGIPEGVTPGQGRGGGPFADGAEGFSPEQMATAMAQNPDIGTRRNAMLIRPLITLLEGKLQP